MTDNKENGITLDEEARKLFAELGGIETREAGEGLPFPRAGLAEALSEEEQRLDATRTLLVEFAYHLANYLTSVPVSGSAGEQEEEIEALLQTVTRLAQEPEQERKILIRYRGMTFAAEGKAAEEYDYVVSRGNIAVNLPVVKTLAKRQGLGGSHLPGRLSRAFEVFAARDINTLHLTFGPWGPEEKRRVTASLRIAARYFQAVAGGASLAAAAEAGNGSPPVVFNENSQPDPNLTLVAGLNGLKRETIQGLVQKVQGLMRQPGGETGLERYASVYEALFAFKKLKAQLIKPPLEINNVRWLILDSPQETVSKEKAQLARAVLDKFADDPQKAAKIVASIYATDFNSLEAQNVGARLGQVSDFLEALETGAPEEPVEEEVLKNVERGLDEVREDVLDDLVVEEGLFKAETGQGETIEGKLHEKLYQTVNFFKRRSGTKRKIRDMVRGRVEFDLQDYEVIARDFEITVQDAERLLDLLKGCFGKKGRFLRDSFERSIPEFARHEKRVFEFLWHYLKEIVSRDDRVAFLNALQFLIARMERPQEALAVLLADFFYSPQTLTFSDRNALILGNVLLRKYNKEIQNDIELTPAEVLLVRDGLDLEVARNAAGLIEREQERFYQKMGTVHQKLKQGLGAGESEPEPMPVRYLITLEREANIFLALAGGHVAHRILQSALKEYGDPETEVYRLTRSQTYMPGLLQLFEVAARGLGRFSLAEDLALLQQVRAREQTFLSLKPDSRHHDLVRRAMKWVETSAKEIGAG